jgi:phosphate transport system protein
VSSQKSDPATDVARLRGDLSALAATVLAQVERAIAAWNDSDGGMAEAIADADGEVDMRSAAIEADILGFHRNWSTFAGDLRLLHVGLIVSVSLERVGNLAVEIARLAQSVPPPDPVLDPVQRFVARMGERAVDALAEATQAVTREDVEAGDRAVRGAAAVGPMLDRVMQAVSQTASGEGMRAWSAAAVLVSRHVERIANNAAEIGARVHFLVTGEPAPLEE